MSFNRNNNWNRRPAKPNPEETKRLIDQMKRPCPRCKKPYTQISPLCEDCLPSLYKERCDGYVQREGRYDPPDGLLVIYGLWKSKEECRSCTNCVPWRKQEGSWDPRNYRVSCSAGKSCLDERTAPGYMLEESSGPPKDWDPYRVIEKRQGPPPERRPQKGSRSRF